MRPLSFRPGLRRRGTSLVELLVVIVVFLIGILAVAQIFPGGFRVLAGTRARSLASTVAMAESERLKSRPDLLPEAILPVIRQDNGTVQTVVFSEKSPRDYAPNASGIDAAGNAVDGGGTALGSWGRLSGPNTYRRIVGETHVIGAPRFLSPTGSSPFFGGLVTLQFGPVEYSTTQPDTLNVYGRDMYRRTTARGLTEPPLSPVDVPREYEYVLTNATSTNQATFPSQLLLPAPVSSLANATPAAFRYSLFIAVYVNVGGTVSRREVELPGVFLVGDGDDPEDRGYATLSIAAIPGVVPTGGTLVGVETDSVRLARAFREVPQADPFTTDPYEYKIMNAFLGTLLFNPAGYNRFEQRPGESRRPLAARVNYNVYDWRILHEDFRVPRERFQSGAQAMPPSVRLAISPMRSSGDAGADGLTAVPMENLGPVSDPFVPGGTGTKNDEHFVLLDLETGGVFYESYQGRTLIDVNKSSGRVRFLPYDSSPTAVATGWLRLPDGSTVQVATANRAVRAFYVGRDEWAVQVLRAPARFTRFLPTPGTPRPVTGTYALGPDLDNGAIAAHRIYFPPADAGRKVTIGRISYVDAGGVRRTYEGGDFVLHYGGPDPMGTLPYIDIQDVAGDAVAFDPAVDIPVASIRGASVVVRVFHTDAKFSLAPTTMNLLAAGNPFDRFLRQWRVDTKETYLDGGEPLQ